MLNLHFKPPRDSHTSVRIKDIRGGLPVEERARCAFFRGTVNNETPKAGHAAVISSSADSPVHRHRLLADRGEGGRSERQRGGLTPRDSRKNSEVAKIPGTFEECISVATSGT